MSEQLYIERVRHFNEERRLCAAYMKSVTPDAHTMHYTAVEAKNHYDSHRAIEEECKNLKDKEHKLSLQFDQKTELIYKAKASEDERSERIEFLSSLPPLVEVERDTTYYYRDSFASKVKPHELNSQKYKPPVSIKRIQSGKESKLEKEIQRETREINELKAAINNYLDSIESKTHQFSCTFNASVGGLKARARELVRESEALDLQAYNTVIDLLALRLKIMTIQREELEDSERLEKEIKYYMGKETSIHMQLNNEVTELNRKYEREIVDSLKEFQHQLHVFNTKESKLMQESKKVEEDNVGNCLIEDLLKEEAAAKGRYERLLQRNRLEMEGFSNESLFLRNRLVSIERQYKNLSRK